MHDGDNVSFHSAVSLEFNIEVSYLSDSSRNFTPRPKWADASEDNLLDYGETLDHLLSSMIIPWEAIQCNNALCTDHDNHCHSIQIFHDTLMDKCITASDFCIPCTSEMSKNHTNIAGWNDIVKPYKEASIFWHNVWKQCGSPRNAAIADVMRRARAKYHNAVKQVKRDQNIIKRNKMAESILCDDTRSFWNEVRNVSAGKNNTLPNMIDGEMGNENISEVFVDKYKTLYNSVSYDKQDMDHLLLKLNKAIECSNEINILSYITNDDILNALPQIKCGKNDGLGIIYTDHFTYGTNRLYIMLALLFNAMIVHGFSPDGLNMSTIQPLIKNKRKSCNESSNYRAIALSSPVAKIFDWVILNKNSDNFSSSDLQYGFKPKSSTTQCTFALMETINYYKQNNSDVYVLLLDASQAFDKVNYIKLFDLLIKRNINPLVIRCLLHMYTNQHLNVRWNSLMSRYFNTSNGVKQGGVLSPILFGVYIDELLYRLSQSGYGCKIGHLYYGAFGYADDVSLVAPSIYALRRMCAIALDYASEYDIKFNPLKCQMINYSNNINVVFNFDGVALKADYKGIHLGHIIGPNVSSDVIQDASYTLIRSVNSVLHNFIHCSYNVKYQLFKTYCTSFYGCPLWDVTSKNISRFYVSWRKSIRKLFDLPYRTHCNLLPAIAECLPIECQILCRISKFVCSSLSSQNHYLSLLMNIVTNGSRSALSKTFNHVLCRCGLSRDIFYRENAYNICRQSIVNSFRADDEVLYRGAFAQCIVHERENPQLLSKAELVDILNFICTE
jgi:hypothetical protein